jgi:hypothetical protein
VGLLGYVLGGPVVHVAHGNGWRALGSLGVRLAVPFLVGLAAWGLFCLDSCSADAAAVGADLVTRTAGPVVGSAVDVLALAGPKEVREKARTAGVVFVPRLAVIGGRAMLGLGARF